MAKDSHKIPMDPELDGRGQYKFFFSIQNLAFFSTFFKVEWKTNKVKYLRDCFKKLRIIHRL